MNRPLYQLFIATLTLFAILAASTTYIMVFRANSLNDDTRNTRALYHEYSVPRGAILASDGTVLAQSTKVNDSFQYQRSYSEGSVFSPVTGYFSVTNRSDRGIEASENSLLNGESSSLWMEKLKATFKSEDNKGATIETSIDPKLQRLAYNLLSDKTGSVVAIEPSTGRILALASTPSYDPNSLATHDITSATNTYTALSNMQPSPMINNALSSLYPPGSTFKITVAAAALETGNYTPDTMIPAGTTFTLPNTDTKVPNAVPQADGTNGSISLANAIAYSSNTAFMQLGISLGSDKINDMATKLGFGSTITVDGSDSTGTPMKATASRFPTGQTADKLALASIGQGDTTSTPLQTAMVAAAVANKGKLMRPTIVDRVRSSDLSIISQTTPSQYSQPFSENTANELNSMMQQVATKEYPFLLIDGTKIAIKTGTAQTGPSNNVIDGWVMGFSDTDNPKIAMAVMLHDTQGFAGKNVGMIFKQMVQEVMNK